LAHGAVTTGAITIPHALRLRLLCSLRVQSEGGPGPGTGRGAGAAAACLRARGGAAALSQGAPAPQSALLVATRDVWKFESRSERVSSWVVVVSAALRGAAGASPPHVTTNATRWTSSSRRWAGRRLYRSRAAAAAAARARCAQRPRAPRQPAPAPAAAPQAVEVIPGRYYATALKYADSLARSRTAAAAVCYCIDHELVRGASQPGVCPQPGKKATRAQPAGDGAPTSPARPAPLQLYEPFYADFGPLNLGKTFRFCEITARLLEVRRAPRPSPRPACSLVSGLWRRAGGLLACSLTHARAPPAARPSPRRRRTGAASGCTCTAAPRRSSGPTWRCWWAHSRCCCWGGAPTPRTRRSWGSSRLRPSATRRAACSASSCRSW
jgi:hypothetical protein